MHAKWSARAVLNADKISETFFGLIVGIWTQWDLVWRMGKNTLAVHVNIWQHGLRKMTNKANITVWLKVDSTERF